MTKKDGSGLSHKQKTAIPIIASIGNREEAARRAGISKDCLYRWLSEKSFRDAVEQLQNEIVSDSYGFLKAAVNSAVGTLIQLTTRSDCPAVQRAAANDILNHTMRFKEIMEIEKRLIQVEKIFQQDMDVKDAKKSEYQQEIS
jgi:hypothetical protein